MVLEKTVAGGVAGDIKIGQVFDGWVLGKKTNNFGSCEVRAVAEVQMCEFGSIANRVDGFVGCTSMIEVEDFEPRETR